MPIPFQEGTLTPIFKGAGKDPTKPGNYRGITVSHTIGKVLETLIVHHQGISFAQNSLQCEFTWGLSPSFASVLLTEAIAEQSHGTIFIATLDAQKAFDVVDHKILARKMYQSGLSGGLWLLKKACYDHLCSSVKYQNVIGDSFNILQGTKQ